jgi:hypothetical protein
MNMDKNVGTTDRYIRYALAGILVVTGFVTHSIIPTLIALVPLATASMSFCPAYTLFKINTIKEGDQS